VKQHVNVWLLEDCIKLFCGQKSGSASATCREAAASAVIAVKQLFPSTQAENWEVVCVYFFVSLISFCIMISGHFHVQGGRISCKG
jgi:hypothetical protein